MSNGSESLHFLVPTYRRDSIEVIGAVRRSAVEFLGMEQMPGGKFQITARTMSGADAFISPVMTSLAEGQQCLEDSRRAFGGEDLPGALVRLSEGREAPLDAYDEAARSWAETEPQEAPVEQVPPRAEARVPRFTFADIEAPELPTSVF